jgi:hypothetical protein
MWMMMLMNMSFKETRDIKKETMSNHTYALLAETSLDEGESWYYFIRATPANLKELAKLERVLTAIDWFSDEEGSVFDIDIEHLVSEQTAKEMCRVEINYCFYHRKFDGTLKQVDFEFKSKDSLKVKIEKVRAKIAFGRIEEYIDAEDIHPDLQDVASSVASASKSAAAAAADIIPGAMTDDSSAIHSECIVDDLDADDESSECSECSSSSSEYSSSSSLSECSSSLPKRAK